MSGALAALPTTSDRAAWTEDEKAVIEAAGLVFVHAYGERRGEKVIAPRPIVAKFLHTCERTGLDPLAKQIYCIGRFGSDGLEWSIQTGIDGFRVIAERSRQYAGPDPAEWLTESGEWVPVFVKALHGDHPLAARVAVHRHDWDRPAVGVATWDEYAQTKRTGELTAMWQQRGPGQLAKCAEALALRKAFPHDLSGLYTDDELGNAVTVTDDEDRTTPRRTRGISTVASRARRAENPAPVEEVVDAEIVDESPEREPTEAGSEVADDFPCVNCGEPRAKYEDGICGVCEAEIEEANRG